MSTITDFNSIGYVNVPQALDAVQNSSNQANFAAYLEDAEKSAASDQSSAVSAAVQPSITSLLRSNSTTDVVKAEEPDIEDERSASGKTAREEFREYMEMTPEERFFVAMLKKKGYTKEEYEALPPEEKQKLQKEIEEDARNRTEQKVETSSIGAPTLHEKAVQNNTVSGVTSSANAAENMDRDKAIDWL